MNNRTITENGIKDALSDIFSSKKLFLNQVDTEAFKRAFILLMNRLNHGVIFNANITVVAEDSEDSDQYGEALADMIERFFPDSCLLASKEQLYSKAYKKNLYKKYRIVLVKGLSDIQPGQLFEILEDAEKDGWTPSFILCTGSRDLEELKSFDRQDYRLFHYLCGLKLQVSPIDVSMILSQTLSALEVQGYGFTDEFSRRLDIYIRAVYPEARLAKSDFVQDLISRIYQIHYQKIVDNDLLDESDVPYSRKAELLLSEVSPSDQAEPASGPEKTAGAPANKPDTLQEKTELEIPELTVQEAHFTDLRGSSNVLLLSMSTLPPAGSHYCFTEKNGNAISYRIFSGLSQLEPGTKLFLSKLADQGLRPDKIIIFTTSETWKTNKKWKKSAVSVYSENIKDFILGKKQTSEEFDRLFRPRVKERDEVITVCKVLYPNELYEAEKSSSSMTSESICCNSPELDELRQYLDIMTIPLEEHPLQEVMHALNTMAKESHVNLFIDLQGGSRSFMFTMFAATTMLRDKNVTIKDMFATRFDRKNDLHPIEILNREYAILDLVTGIRAFTRYGKVDELKRFLQSRNLNTESSEARLLEIMETIDGCMQINNPEGFTDALKKLADGALLSEETYHDEQFRLIVEDLNNTYNPLIRDGNDVLDQIKWFGEKSFITSALTFIEAKFPAFVQADCSGPMITTDINNSLTDKDISYNCGGAKYYSRETNIFFGFSRLVENAENGFFRALCEHWADRLLERLKESGGTYTLKCGSLLGSVDKIKNNASLAGALLKIERNLGIAAWNDLPAKSLFDLTKESPANWSIFKQRYRIANNCNKNTEIKNVSYGTEKKAIDYRFIMNLTSDSQTRTQGRLDAVRTYLTTNDYPFILPSETDNDIRRARETVLKELIVTGLYSLLYDNKDRNKPLAEYIEKILRPLIGTSSALMTQVPSVNYDGRPNNLIFTCRGYDKDRFFYELWLEMMTLDTDSGKAELEYVVSEYVVSAERIRDWEDSLNSLFNKLSCTESPGIEQLMEFARAYARCRMGKENLKADACISEQDGRCSYRNLKLYTRLSDSVPGASEYRQILSSYFRSEDDHLLTSVAGICNTDYMSLKKEDGIEIFHIKPVTGNVIHPDSRLLDVCLHLYYALKKERNASNHAEEVGSNHMDYRLTRMAVSVFVELCSRLKQRQ